MPRSPDDRPPSRAREAISALGFRLLLAAASVVLLWLAARRWRDMIEEYQRLFELPSLGEQLQVVVLGVLAGLTLGLATVLPAFPWRYGVSRAIAAALVPMVVVLAVLLRLSPTGVELVPRWVSSFLDAFGGEVVIIASMLLGVALAAGFTASGPRAASPPDMGDAA